MAELQEITDIEQAYFELEKIKRQVNTLSDFLASKLRHNQQHKPKTAGMIDPRTGKPFRRRNKADHHVVVGKCDAYERRNNG